MRETPSTSSRIVTTLNRLDAMTPVLVSDHDDSLDGAENYFWYKCFLEPDRRLTGWVYGKYVTCKLLVDDPKLYVVSLRVQGEGDASSPIGCFFLQSFIDGEFQHMQPNGELSTRLRLMPSSFLRSKHEDILQISVDSSMHDGGINWITAKGTERGTEFAEVTTGRLPEEVSGLLGTNITLGKITSIGSPGQKEVLPFPSLHSYICSEFQKVAKSPAVDFSDISVTHEEFYKCPINDNGHKFAGDLYYFVFAGVFENWNLKLCCFVIKQPDGNLVRSNIELSAWEGDYRLQDTILGKGGIALVGPWNVENFAPLPIRAFVYDHRNLTYSPLCISNGYVVFNLGYWLNGE